jgi:hypothetical protein
VIDHCQFPSSLSSRGSSRYLRAFFAPLPFFLRHCYSLRLLVSVRLRRRVAASRPLTPVIAVDSLVYELLITELQFISGQDCE